MHSAKCPNVVPFALLLALALADCSGGRGGSLPSVGASQPVGAQSEGSSATLASQEAPPLSTFSAAQSLASGNAANVTPDAATKGETALSADSLPGGPDASNNFIDSIGADTKLNFAGSTYSNYTAVKADLLDLGIRHIRDTFSTQNLNDYERHLDDLAAAGIHSVLGLALVPNANNTADVNVTGSQATAYLAAGHYRQSLEALEGINEPDINANGPSGPSPAGWVALTQKEQRELFMGAASLKAPAKRVPVYGPSVATRDVWQVGNLSAYMDAGNVHDYSGGWDLAGATIENVLALERSMSGSKPIVTTENGYSTGWLGQSMPNAIMLDYAQRLFFKQFAHGIKRTYWYELLDENAKPNDYWHNTGLVTSSFARKPAFAGLKNLIALLKDPTSPRPRTALNFSFGAQPPFENIEHVLLQKNDGSFWLAVWRDVNEWIPANNGLPGAYPNPLPATIPNALNFMGTYVSSITQYEEDWTGAMHSTPVAVTAGSTAQIAIGARPRIFKIVPGVAPAAPAAPVITGAAAHWSLNEASGNVALNSRAATAAMALPANGKVGWLTGRYGAGLTFSGTEATTSAAAIDTSKSYSATAWVQLNSLTGYQAAFAVNGRVQSAFAIDFTPEANLSYTTYTDDSASKGTTRIGSGIVPVVGRWYAVAATYNGVTHLMSFYVNGQLQSTTRAPAVFNGRNGMEIGSMLQGGVGHWQWWNGSVDEVNLYARQLTAGEVRTMAGL